MTICSRVCAGSPDGSLLSRLGHHGRLLLHIFNLLDEKRIYGIACIIKR